MQGNAAASIAQFQSLLAEADAAHNDWWRWGSLLSLGHLLAHVGDTTAARAAATGAIEAAADFGDFNKGFAYASLTPAELNVVRLVGEGLRSKDIAERRFVSPRTVQAHLGHVYAKLGVKLQSAARARGSTPRLRIHYLLEQLMMDDVVYEAHQYLPR